MAHAPFLGRLIGVCLPCFPCPRCPADSCIWTNTVPTPQKPKTHTTTPPPKNTSFRSEGEEGVPGSRSGANQRGDDSGDDEISSDSVGFASLNALDTFLPWVPVKFNNFIVLMSVLRVTKRTGEAPLCPALPHSPGTDSVRR